MYTYKAKLIRVVDGDTVDLTLDLGFNTFINHRFRLHGVDTPEVFGVKKGSEEYEKGIKAKNRVAELLEGKNIKVETFKDRKDKYGRYLAVIYVDKICINDLLFEEGLAKIYT